MKVSAFVKSEFNHLDINVSTNAESKTLSISPKSSGYGSLVNGAELLLLSLATCYCNDIYREAAKRGIEVSEVSVEVSGEFGAEGEPGRNFRYRPTVKSNAPAEQIDELLDITDEVAEIHKTLRQGLDIKLIK